MFSIRVERSRKFKFEFSNIFPTIAEKICSITQLAGRINIYDTVEHSGLETSENLAN